MSVAVPILASVAGAAANQGINALTADQQAQGAGVQQQPQQQVNPLQLIAQSQQAQQQHQQQRQQQFQALMALTQQLGGGFGG